jgi:hypothetical protein
MNKRPFVFVSLAVSCLLFIAPPASAGTCSAQTTRGAWMYTCEGTLPAPAQTATRILGSCTASKTGYFNCTGTVNLGGQILSQGLQGQATTHPNCTGTISYNQTVAGSPAPNLDINYVVSGDGSQINGLPTNSGGVLSCTLRRIDKDGD